MPGKRVLLTAFRPYDDWTENVSWSALVALTRELPSEPELATRLYPVDLSEAAARIESDLDADFDYIVHLGQAAGAHCVRLERFAVNWFRDRGERPGAGRPIERQGPPAYHSAAPLDDWAAAMRAAGVPAEVSNHAGDYLCNATLYLSHHRRARSSNSPAIAFLHLPPSCEQIIGHAAATPSLPLATSVTAIRTILARIAAETPVSV